MRRVIGNVFFKEGDFMTLTMKRFENGAVGGGVTIAPRRGNGESENGEFHPHLGGFRRYDKANVST